VAEVAFRLQVPVLAEVLLYEPDFERLGALRFGQKADEALALFA
jgi:hypothetical protein